MKIRFFFAWFDMWMGAYWSKRHKTLYICILPTVVLALNFSGLPRRWEGEQNFCDECSTETKWLYYCEECDGVYCEECYGDILEQTCSNCQLFGFNREDIK